MYPRLNHTSLGPVKLYGGAVSKVPDERLREETAADARLVNLLGAVAVGLADDLQQALTVAADLDCTVGMRMNSLLSRPSSTPSDGHSGIGRARGRGRSSRS